MDKHLLSGKKALVVGIANEHSIAYGCARMLRKAGAELAITYLNSQSKPFIEPLLPELNPAIFLPCNVTQEGEIETVFEEISTTWGELDILVHSIAFAPKEDLQNPLHKSSKEGFLMAMDITCHSFIRMARLAQPLMSKGGSLFAMSFYGAEKVVHNYNLMGPIKAALESSVRYLAAELGHQKIRVIALSPGPLKTRAASGLEDFDSFLEQAKEKSPLSSLVDITDVGAMLTFLASDYAKNITGNTIYIDSGFHIIE